MLIFFEGELYRVLNVTHITPGNKRGKVQSELRNLRTGTKRENRFRSEDSVEKATLEEREMEYLYQDGEAYTFMNTSNYEQTQLNREDLGNAVHYLKPNTRLKVDFFEDRAIGVELPSAMELQVTETSPPMKGATASRGAKPALLENGLTIKVPQFVQSGDRIRVDTVSNEYVERVS